MPDVKSNKVLHTKSYASVYDILGALSYGNLIRNMGLNKRVRDHSVYLAACGESLKRSADGDYPVSKSTNYVTSEKYNYLNNENSGKTVVPSTSTIFYDLDDIAKRHSFHCLTEFSVSNPNFMKVMKMSQPCNLFGEKSNIVQECATQIHPKLFPRDSIELNSKKVKKKFSKLSSEIFLRDDDYLRDYQKLNHYYKDTYDKQQKFWSYAKYRTEYTKPIPEEKKCKKKEHGKRTEDPCPCQLFSYACPCTDKKSLTESVKNSKSLTGVDQVTSTFKIVPEENEKKKEKIFNKLRKLKQDTNKEDKPTNTSTVEMIEVLVPNKKNDPSIQIANKKDVPVLSEKNNNGKNLKNKSKGRRKSRRVLCPNCKEKVDVVISISTTEEEESLKYEHSSMFRSKEIPSTTAYAYRASPNGERSKTMDDGDLCLHDPRCELLPVCQILPTDNFCNANQKCVNKHCVPKPTPRIIRITKACRHHPPCTVVPSCQRANVLKNNCEYIPPCLHRPRCVNLPLCVPFSKSLHYEEINKVIDERDNADCPHIPKCKYIPMCQHDSLSNTMDQQVNMVSRVPNGCEFLNDYRPTFLLNPKSTCVANTFSPCELSPSPCYMDQFRCRPDKSCQFDSTQCKCTNEVKENPSEETVIFIRDVGCQFRNKNYSPKESMIHSKVSSNSFDFVDVKIGNLDNYYTNVHTLRYEDKFTNPRSGGEHSFSTVSITSLELDSECPSHGRRASQNPGRHRTATGFVPKSAYVTAFSTHTEPSSDKYEYKNMEAFPVKSRRSFLKGRYRKMFNVKRRRKSRLSNPLLISCSKKSVYEPNIL
ncbi:uncharacterized protein LOC126056719 [Helicoverpa armigera]|uniref:uncharacterized protein LOC126056719 n=1 Tax=Helicoverpa armigera TaxID=29058 RepID=UPI00308358C4